MFKKLCFSLLALGSINTYSMKNVIKIFSRYGTVIITGRRGTTNSIKCSVNPAIHGTVILKNPVIISQLERSIKNAKKRHAICAMHILKRTNKKDFIPKK